MVTRRMGVWALAVFLSTAAVAACSLNPQPLPPAEPDGGGGTSGVVANPSTGGSAGTAGGGGAGTHGAGAGGTSGGGGGGASGSGTGFDGGALVFEAGPDRFAPPPPRLDGGEGGIELEGGEAGAGDAAVDAGSDAASEAGASEAGAGD